jgi:hypothetical protein
MTLKKLSQEDKMGIRKQLKKKKNRKKSSNKKNQDLSKNNQIEKIDDNKKEIFAKTTEKTEVEIDYTQNSYVKRDLIKTIIVCFFIICLLFGFYFLLK